MAAAVAPGACTLIDPSHPTAWQEGEHIAESLSGSRCPDETLGRNDRALAGLRIAVGLLFLTFGEYKVFGGEFVFGGGFQGWIQRFLAEGGAYPFMVPILRGFVLPHGHAIAFLVAYGEFAIGLSLVLGLWVRVASSCGLLYMLALLFSANYPGSDAVPWQYFGAALNHLVLALCFATFAVGAPEQAWSLARAWPRRSRSASGAA